MTSNLKVDIKTLSSDTVAKDCVISVEPGAGTKVDKGTTVTIFVSIGKEGNTDTETGTEPTDEPKPDDGTEQPTEPAPKA